MSYFRVSQLLRVYLLVVFFFVSSLMDAVAYTKVKQTEPTGILYSQLGYDSRFPVKIVLRGGTEIMNNQYICRIYNNEDVYKSNFVYWGEKWGISWSVAEFSDMIEPGKYKIEVFRNDTLWKSESGLEVKKDILWDKTYIYSTVDMLERRANFSKFGCGWQDAGTMWMESPAQSAMIISMAEIFEYAKDKIDQLFFDRLIKQMQVGCDYLIKTQERAEEFRFPEGAMSHDLLAQDSVILPADALKAVIALIKTSKLLPKEYMDKAILYENSAKKAFHWLVTNAKPLGKRGMSLFQRGLKDDFYIPEDEWQTRDLIMFCWAAYELSAIDSSYFDKAIIYADEVIERQIPKEKSECGFYGHFYEFESIDISEKSWTHGIVNNEFGADMGGIYPNYLYPIVLLAKNYPTHNNYPKWINTLDNFVKGYLLPSCNENPFKIVPQGIFKDEGPIWFCATFHGMNAIYGYTAALALDIYDLLKDKQLCDIAYSNLLWIAGLNSGLTTDMLNSSVVYNIDIEENEVLLASMICGIGNRWMGTWFQTRGVVCNGISTGKQFVYDVEAKKENDKPESLSDEDWIPHSAAWISGLIRLIKQ